MNGFAFCRYGLTDDGAAAVIVSTYCSARSFKFVLLRSSPLLLDDDDLKRR
jgi:hypothetical protein